jgi:hypothetical protein
MEATSGITCATRAQLQQQYDPVSVFFENARKRLLERVAICSSEDLRALSEEVECVCDLLDQARAALDWHIHQHRCEGKRSRHWEDASSSAFA